MPEQRHVRVTLRVDTDRFVAALRRASASMPPARWRWLYAALEHGARHHRREHPARSVMHAAYDRRRQARRRKGRR